MANEHDPLLRQIDEEVRREKLAKLWDKYGVLVIGVIAVALIGVLGFNWYRAEVKRSAERAGGQYAEAGRLLAEGKSADALSALEAIAKSGPDGYAQLARLRLAAEARDKGRTADAISQYSALAKDASADPLFVSFAKLQIASLKVDTASFTEVKNQLNDLLNETNPWRHSAREILGLAAYKAGNYAEARKVFQELLVGKGVPQAMVQRAQIAMAMIARDELQAKSGAPKTTPAGTPPAKTNGAEAPANAKTQ